MPVHLRKPARGLTAAAKHAGPDPAQDPDTNAPDGSLLQQAIRELGIDRPILMSRLVGNRLELTLYGGDLVYWPPAKPRR